MRKRYKICAGFTLCCLLTLLFLELGVRWTRLASRLETQAVRERTISILFEPELTNGIEPDEQLFWRFKPNLKAGYFSTNKRGFRGGPLKTPKSGTRVLAIGDSCTFGFKVPEEDTYPAELQRLLDAAYGPNSFEVINAGVPGYSSFQGLRLLESLADDLRPDVVIWGLGANDSTSWSGISDTQFASLLRLKGYERLLAWSSTYRAIRLLVKGWILDPPIHTPSEIVDREMSGKRPRVLNAEYESNLRAALGFCQSRGIRVIILLWPMTYQVCREKSLDPPFPELARRYAPYEDTMRVVAQETHVCLLDMLAEFTAARGGGHLFIDASMHPSREGYAIAAKALLEELSNSRP